MSLFKAIERVKQIDSLIRQKATGNSHEFAEKVGIGRSMLMSNIKEFRDSGIKIKYDSNRHSYIYVDNSFVFKIEIKTNKKKPVAKPD